MNDFHELFKRYISSEHINWDKIGRLPAEMVSVKVPVCSLCKYQVLCKD